MDDRLMPEVRTHTPGVEKVQPGPQEPTESWMTGMPKHMMPGLRWRAVASITIVFGWVAFILLFAGFWAGAFTLFQNIMIFFASIVVAIGLLAVMWAAWGLRWAR